MRDAVIKKCECLSTGQDRLYGRGNRFHYLNKEKDKATCSVCGDIKPVATKTP